VAEKTPSAGGFDNVMVIDVLPLFVTAKLDVGCCPTTTVPNEVERGEIVSFPGGAHVPDRFTVAEPAVVAMLIDPVYIPTAVGLNVTVTLTWAPGAITVPGAGAPLSPKGAAGADTELMVSAAPPTLLNVTVSVICPPTGVPPKLTNAGATVNCAFGERPVPVTDRLARTVEPFVIDTVAPVRPVVVGVKVTGMLSVAPA
jgi:hypothetical protein